METQASVSHAREMQVRFSLEMNRLGYTTLTRFYEEFTLAESDDGARGVKAAYEWLFSELTGKTAELTEVVMVLNHKMWEHYESGDMSLSQLYCELWKRADGWCCQHLKADDMEYYYRITD